ncbi:MAG: bifunctional 3-(3-hydroxy-phenyl)propionate/3-hydroxycinnamic acid hydroxylase, partial [Candidatus Rokuibacteriota bacterium]
LSAFFASLGGIGAHVAPGGPVDDVDGSYARWFRDHDVGVVLQRPDFHVFGTAATPDGAAGLVGRLRDALAGSR